MKQKLQLSLDVLINEFASTFLYCLKNIFNWSLSIDLAQINMVFNPLTDGRGIECPPLAKSAPVHQGLTFEWP